MHKSNMRNKMRAELKTGESSSNTLYFYCWKDYCSMLLCPVRYISMFCRNPWHSVQTMPECLEMTRRPRDKKWYVMSWDQNGLTFQNMSFLYFKAFFVLYPLLHNCQDHKYGDVSALQVSSILFSQISSLVCIQIIISQVYTHRHPRKQRRGMI